MSFIHTFDYITGVRKHYSVTYVNIITKNTVKMSMSHPKYYDIYSHGSLYSYGRPHTNNEYVVGMEPLPSALMSFVSYVPLEFYLLF